MHSYKVGELYTDRTTWPELAQYNYRGGEHELILFFNKPTSKEVHAIAKERAEFALFVERRLIVIVYRFGTELPWSDAPYSIHLVPSEQRTTPPEVEMDERAWLHIVLVDASTGIIKALRSLTMTPEFTWTLHQAIREQAKMPFTRSEYNSELDALFSGYRSHELAQMAGTQFSSTSTKQKKEDQ